MASNRPSIRNSRFAYAKTVVKMIKIDILYLKLKLKINTILNNKKIYINAISKIIYHFLPVSKSGISIKTRPIPERLCLF